MAENEAKPGGLSRLRIAKKAYVFDVRKRYAVSRNYAVARKAGPQEGDLRETLRGLLSGKKPSARKEEQKAPPAAKQPQAPQKPPAPSRKNTVLIAILATLALFIIGGAAFVFLRLSSPESGGGPAAALGEFSGSFGYELRENGLLSVLQGEKEARTAYFLIDYQSQNLTGLNFTARIFAARPSTQVFLLDYAREGADSYPVFRRSLLDGFARRGVNANEISIDQLASLPGGAVVIVPTGYFPKELLGMGSQFDYKTLLSRGNSIVYIGFPIDRALDSNGLTIPVRVPEMSFSKAKPASTGGFRLFDAQYVAGPGAAGQLSAGGQVYGSVSVIRYGGGVLLFLPQSLDGGWRGDDRTTAGEAAAQDVVRLVVEAPWMTPAAVAQSAAKAGVDGKQVLTMLTGPFFGDSAYAEFSADASDAADISRRSVDVFMLSKEQNGEMNPREEQAVPYYISGQLTRFNIVLAENSSKPVKLYVRLYQDGRLAQEEELELGLTSPTTEKPKDVQLMVEPGTYIVRVEDREGKVYAATVLQVRGLDTAFNSTDWAARRFSFLLSAAGEPVNPRMVAVSMDGKNERKYSSSSYSFMDSGTGIEYSYPDEIRPGNHTFYFTVGNVTTTLSTEYRPPRYPWDNPLVDALALLSILVFGIGYMLRRPEILKYGLDIPDFPPTSAIKIPVKRQAMLQLFNEVNAGYSWQWMPLRADEVKNGFRRLTHNGKSILIGDFNLERLLARLKDEGLVKEELGYWGLSEWETQSGRSITYLAIYRIMRNVFVNNAVRFSKLGAMADCDVKAIAGKEEMYFHIMEGRDAERTAHRALATAKKGTTIIVFRTEDEVRSFGETLTSTSKLAVALKMEINGGNILLLPVKNAISAYLKGVVK